MGFKKACKLNFTVENVAFDSCDYWVLYQNVDEFTKDLLLIIIMYGFKHEKSTEKMDFILEKVNTWKPICAEEEYEDALGPFRVPPGLCIKTRLGAQPFLWK